MPHPWKAEYLTVATWYEPEEIYCDWDEADDDEFELLHEHGESCPYCFTPYAYGYGCCCYDWDDDCWIDRARPWTALDSAYYEDQPRLTRKGAAMVREYHDEHVAHMAGLAERKKIRKARRRWMVLKNAIDAKRIALYWQEQTQQRLCAPGGAGRAADAAAFVAEF